MDGITGYIIEDVVGDKDLNNIPQKIMKLIDNYISSYWYVIISPEQLDMIKRANNMTDVIGNIDSYCLGEKEYTNKKALEEE